MTSSGAPRSAAARTVSSHEPICDSVVATRSIGASRNQVSTSLASHQAPIPRTASSEARQTASAAASPALSRRVGASPQSVSQKPPFRPLGPWPQTAASSTRTSSSGCRVSNCQAVQRPRYPPPTITTSAVASPSSGRVGVTPPASSSHQPWRVCRVKREPESGAEPAQCCTRLPRRPRWGRSTSKRAAALLRRHRRRRALRRLVPRELRAALRA